MKKSVICVWKEFEVEKVRERERERKKEYKWVWLGGLSTLYIIDKK